MPLATTHGAAPDLASPRFKANPYPFYARLRADAPVWHTTVLGRRPAWLMTRYDDVVGILKDERFVKNRLKAVAEEQTAAGPWIPSFLKPLERNMLDLDAPDHSRLRALVHQAFTARLVERLRERIQSLTDELLDAAQAQSTDGTLDLVSVYALPLPSIVIADLLGVPASDRRRFHRWSSALATISTAGDMLWAVPHAWAFMRYVRQLVARRRTDPQDDLITALLQAEASGDTLSEDELLAMVVLLLIAGHETTVNLIASGTLALLEYPDERERLRRDPALIKPAIEELLRFTSPVDIATERYSSEDVTLAGTTIPRGGLVLAAVGSANRDEHQFPNPETLDLDREPNRHLAFGQGMHYCLGAPLARLEGQIAISTLLRRMPDLRLAVAPESLRWRRGLILRGLEALPVTLQKA
jgi:cytochrome P450